MCDRGFVRIQAVTLMQASRSGSIPGGSNGLARGAWFGITSIRRERLCKRSPVPPLYLYDGIGEFQGFLM